MRLSSNAAFADYVDPEGEVDDVERHVETRREADERAEILRDIGLEEGKTHGDF